MKVPGVTGLKRVLNESVVKALFDKTKERADYHPDYFRLNFTTNMALHCEIDETSTNEDDHNRLQRLPIRRVAGGKGRIISVSWPTSTKMHLHFSGRRGTKMANTM
jgi:hypothetical protein